MANTVVVPDWIESKLFENVLRDTVPNFQAINDFKVLPALAPGENYATIMLRIQADVQLTTGSMQRQTFVLKVALDSEIYRTEMSKWNMFSIEAGMYNEIKPEFEKLYKDVGLDVRFGANSYQLSTDKEYILLEDLSVRGFKNVKRQDGLDMNHCKAVLKKLAQFHAASVVRVEQKGMFEDKYLHGFIKQEVKTFSQAAFDGSTPYLLKTIKGIKGHEEYYEQLKCLLANITDILFENYPLDESEFNVLNHGDFWCNNIMFQYDKEGNLLETYLVDLQMPRYGSPAQDLLYFIISSAQLDIKVKQFDYLITYYHNNLIEHLKLLKYNKTLPTLRDIHKALIKYGIWGIVTTQFIMAGVLCDPTDTANIDNFVGDTNSDDSQKFKELLYSNERFVQHLEVVLPWLYHRGAFEC